MCGIGGILRQDGGPIPDQWLDAIDARIAHRGPDGAGRFTDRVEQDTPDGPRVVEVALVHRRLSIIDLEDGDQPMISEQGRVDSEGLLAVVFNGCIYNHHQLRAKLETEGHHFTTDHSDTEVLLHGYRQWGALLEEHLEGMYAFAIWDRVKASLLLCRDWFGEKPLYVRSGVGGDPKSIAFASDAKGLATFEGAQAIEPPRRWTERFLQLGYNHDGCTVYDGAGLHASGGVHQVPPSIVEKHESMMPPKTKSETTPARFEELLEHAVARRLESDVPLGCFLSGGVDSSLIAHYAKQHKPDLRTFSVKMPDDRYDESPHAQRVADHLGTDHTTLEVSMDPANDLVHLIETLGQPFGDSSILPTYWVSKAAREHVKVAISGDGGDELFIGYERYLAARALNRHRRVLKWIPRSWRRKNHPTTRKHKLGRLGDMARDLPTLGIASMESIFTQEQITSLLCHTPVEPIRQDPDFDPMQSLRRFDLIGYLPDDLLCKVDTASMAVALEVRAPFLDREVVRAALAAPTHQLVPKGRRKGLLRSIAANHLPADIVNRPKMGFAIPIGEWFRDDFGGMQTLLLDHLRRDDPFGPIDLHREAVDKLIDEHLEGDDDHSQRLFALLTLAIWARSFA